MELWLWDRLCRAPRPRPAWRASAATTDIRADPCARRPVELDPTEEVGDLIFRVSVTIPHLHLLWEGGGGQLIRIRAMNAAHQEMLLIRRRAHQSVNAGLAERRQLAAGRIEIREL